MLSGGCGFRSRGDLRAQPKLRTKTRVLRPRIDAAHRQVAGFLPLTFELAGRPRPAAAGGRVAVRAVLAGQGLTLEQGDTCRVCSSESVPGGWKRVHHENEGFSHCSCSTVTFVERII
jgi:hypothetical protein